MGLGYARAGRPLLRAGWVRRGRTRLNTGALLSARHVLI